MILLLFYWDVSGNTAIVIGFLTAIAALATSLFAWKQHMLEKTKLRMEAYDRRIKVYDAIKGLIATVMIEGNADYPKLGEMLRETKHALFLFDEEEITNYIKKLYDQGLDLDYKERKLQDKFGPVIGEERETLSLEVLELHRWFAAQLEIVDEKFKPYLKL